jgi:hypothetical protein
MKATEIRNRKYEAIVCFSITFEADDSGAEGDVQFRMIAEDILGASFTHLRIAAKTKNVGLKIQNWMVPILGGRPDSKNLITIHYAGHGAISQVNGKLLCRASTGSPQYFAFDVIIERLALPILSWDQEQLALTDVVVFLDCCCAGAATRSGNVTGRTVEIMAATDENTTANTRTSAIS